MEHIISSPTQILREPMNKEKYCIYVAFEGRVSRNEDEHSDYFCPMEKMFHVTVSIPCKFKKSQDICKSVCTNTEEWLSIQRLLFTLHHTITYFLIPLFVREKSKWQMVDMYVGTW
jgi:hypothetical protein